MSGLGHSPQSLDLYWRTITSLSDREPWETKLNWNSCKESSGPSQVSQAVIKCAATCWPETRTCNRISLGNFRHSELRIKFKAEAGEYDSPVYPSRPRDPLCHWVVNVSDGLLTFILPSFLPSSLSSFLSSFLPAFLSTLAFLPPLVFSPQKCLWMAQWYFREQSKLSAVIHACYHSYRPLSALHCGEQSP